MLRYVMIRDLPPRNVCEVFRIVKENLLCIDYNTISFIVQCPVNLDFRHMIYTQITQICHFQQASYTFVVYPNYRFKASSRVFADA